jgi:hypothetical protein
MVRHPRSFFFTSKLSVCGTDEEVAEERSFCALRFATQACGSKELFFSSTYGTTEVVP